MSIFDWLFTGLLSCTILFFLFSLYFFFSRFQTKKKLKQLNQRPPKKKKRKKKWRRQRQQLQKKAKGQVLKILIMLLLSVGSLGGALYARYYQLTNLDSRDNEMLVQSYFLIDEIEEELLKIQNGANPEKSEEKLLNRTSLLITYTSNAPSMGLAVEGQRVLKRYYNSAKELGINLNAQRAVQYKDPAIVERYLSDIQKVKERQEKAFKEFKINQSALQQSK